MGAIFKIWDTYISPATDKETDIGSSALRFGSGYINNISANAVNCTSSVITSLTVTSVKITNEIANLSVSALRVVTLTFDADAYIP